MAEVTTGTTNFGGTLVTLVKKEVQQVLRNDLVWLQPGAYMSAKIVPGTNQARFVAYGDMPVNDSLVATEGAPMPPEAFGIGYQTLNVQQRMRSVRITDVSMDDSPHDLYAIAAEKVGRNAAAVADFVIASAVLGSTLSTWWPNGRANRAALTTGDQLTAATLRAVVARLKKRNVPTFPDGTYHAMVDPNVVSDLQSDTAVGGWIEASKYGAPEQLMNGEIGKIAGVRFIESNVGLAVNTAGGVGSAFNIYSTVFFGPDYFAFGDLQTIRSYLVPPGGNHTDPAAQSALVSWKGMYGVEVMGDNVEAGMATVGAGPRFINLEHIGTIDF
jgi:N4-gp56 family major capsid protein